MAEVVEAFAEEVDVGSVRILLRNRGAGVKEVEEATGARVRLNPTHPNSRLTLTPRFPQSHIPSL